MQSGTRLKQALLKSVQMTRVCLVFLMLGLPSIVFAELLGHISEDDMPAQQQTVSTQGTPLSYKVHCSDADVNEPDCGLPPLQDELVGLKPNGRSATQSVGETAESLLENWRPEQRP